MKEKDVEHNGSLGAGTEAGWLDRWYWQLLLLVLWVLLLGLTFPWPNWWWCAYLSLAPVALVSVWGRPLWRVSLMAYVLGAGWWLYAISWLAQVTFPGYFVLSLIYGLWFLAFFWAVRLIYWQLRLPLTLVVPLVWVAGEYYRGVGECAVPLYLLGHSQPTWVIQIADSVGVYGVSFFAGMAGGLIADLVGWYGLRSVGSARSWWWSVLAPIVWVGVLSIGVVCYGWYRVAETDALSAESRRISVGVVQTDIAQGRRNNDKRMGVLEMLEEAVMLTEQMLSGGTAQPALIAWPETLVVLPINDAFLDQRPDIRPLRQMVERSVASFGSYLLTGSLAVEGYTAEDQAYQRYNTAYLFDPTGRMQARYDKVNLVPFGEFIPWISHWPWLKRQFLAFTPYSSDYSVTPGRGVGEPMVLDVDGHRWRFGSPICFEDIVAWVCREMVYGRDGIKRADFLVNLTNDGWYPGTAEGPHHEQIARFRCVENRVPMARSVNRGISGFIDSAGRVRMRLRVNGQSQCVAGVAVAELVADPRSTWFGWWGDSFAAGCLVLVLAGVVVSIGKGLSGSLSKKTKDGMA